MASLTGALNSAADCGVPLAFHSWPEPTHLEMPGSALLRREFAYRSKRGASRRKAVRSA
jgi:hypothetical protein